eukprot:PITA_05673
MADSCCLHRPHVVVVPLPAQGHINALMHFSKTLAARGLLITFLTTERLHHRIFRRPHQEISAILQDHHGLHIRFQVMPDGMLPDGGGATKIGELFEALQTKIGPVMEQILWKVNEDGPPITCILSDSFFASTHQVAASLKVPRVVFWPYCAAASVAQANTQLLISQGFIPIKAEDVKNPTKLITCLPGIPPLLPKDLRSFYREECSSDLMFHTQVYESEIQNKADWVLVNTFEELEGAESIRALSKGYPAQAVGPVFLGEFLQGERSFPKDIIRTSLWEENEECMRWLEKQAPTSVLYVSFGSYTLVSRAQLQELALGLAGSEQPFLWVIRPDLVEGECAAITEDYLHCIKDQGLLVTWAPQLKVLSHPSVGGFLTHNGWNSTIESISMGVPMIGWPYWSEQFLNCRFSRDIWKVGMDLEGKADENGLIRSVEIEKVVRRLMQGYEGRELRKNAAKLKEAAIKAVMPGGSSQSNIDTFVEHVRNLSRQQNNMSSAGSN